MHWPKSNFAVSSLPLIDDEFSEQTLRQIITHEQEHEIDLADALGSKLLNGSLIFCRVEQGTDCAPLRFSDGAI